MLVMGINEGRTFYNKKLKDGSVCLLNDEAILCAIAEERVIRQKQAGGYEAAELRIESQLGIKRSEVDVIATSSCCEPLMAGCSHSENPRRYCVDHHLSHACSAYFMSPFEKAIIAVVDAGGNVLVPMEASTNWWEYPREQHSYYLATGNSLNLIGRDCQEPYAMGLGEFYRAVTHFLGWSSSEYCGNTMSLSAYGYAGDDWPAGFSINDDCEIFPQISNDPARPEDVIESFLNLQGIRVRRRYQGELLAEQHKDVAHWAQKEIERALFAKLSYLMTRFGVYDLCLAGGVALNCQLLGRLWDNTPVNRVFIPIAPNDAGQALGNALFIRHCILGIEERIQIHSPNLGIRYDLSRNRLINLVQQLRMPLHVWVGPQVPDTVAEALTQARTIGLFIGQSEFGPRALGFRSILGDPRGKATCKRLNDSIKKREDFMPYAPSVLLEEAHMWFDIKGPSPYMQYAFHARPDRRSNIPAVIHADGTSRLQEVTKDNSPLLYRILKSFKKKTGIPIVLNTSMNRRGEPIVETPEDALDLFLTTDIDAIAFGNDILVSREDIELSKILECHLSLVPTIVNYQSTCLKLSSQRTLSDVRTIVRAAYPDLALYFRKDFGLLKEYFDWLKSGRKTTTIRWQPGAIDIPVDWTLPIRITSALASNASEEEGQCEITSITLKKYTELDDTDAKRDGFRDIDGLREALEIIYGKIPRTAVITIYDIILIKMITQA